MAKLTSLQTIKSNEVNSIDGLYLAHKVNDNPETYEDKRINIDALAGALPTEDIKYDNSKSELTATNVQGAIDELAAGGREVLNDLTDVTITNPAANQLLQYNSTTEKWENKQYIIPTELNELSDVNIASTPKDRQVLSYNATSSKWVAGAPGSSGVELTQAEYDTLEQAGELEENTPYFIKDVNGDGSQFQPVIYSTTEREIGVWTDGKPLYEKTASVTIENSSAQTLITVSNAEYKRIEGFVSSSSGVVPVPFNDGTSLYVPYTDGNEVRLAKNNASSGVGSTLILTIQYTKSTDTAGSGTWTPQGVPAVHYSTTEHIVGTWIDGSPVYEKTQYISALPSSVGDWVNYPHGISNFDRLIPVSATAYNSDIPQQLNIPHVSAISNVGLGPQIAISVSDTNIAFIVGQDRSSWEAYVTIRYTKTST